MFLVYSSDYHVVTLGDHACSRFRCMPLPAVLASRPEIAFYVAGGDIHRDDQIGGLGLSTAAARERDRLVLMACAGAGIPVAIVLAGGYPRSLDTLVEIHCATFDEAKTLSAFA